MSKTIDDVTREEWTALTVAAIELLNMARFMFWLEGSGAADKGDTSKRDCLDKMAFALNVIGLPQGTIEEFDSNLEAMLRSGKSPEEWMADTKRGRSRR